MIERLDYDGCLSDSGRLAEALARSGLGTRACGEKAALFRQAAVALQVAAEANSNRSPLAFFVPGRIEVLGKHTDYAGGRSLLTATERGFAVVVAPRDDSQIRLLDVSRGQEVEFALDPQLSPQAGHWSNYPMTVARRIARNFSAARRGMTFAFISDLPQAAGLSSSSALVVAVYLALEAVNELAPLPEYQQSLPQLLDLAGYLGAVENGQSFGLLAGDRGVGTFGGSEDHTAILTSRPGVLSQYAYRPVRLERTAAVPAGYTFVVGASGVVAEKTGGARERYNRASRMVRILEELWRASGEPGEEPGRGPGDFARSRGNVSSIGPGSTVGRIRGGRPAGEAGTTSSPRTNRSCRPPPTPLLTVISSCSDRWSTNRSTRPRTCSETSCPRPRIWPPVPGVEGRWRRRPLERASAEAFGRWSSRRWCSRSWPVGAATIASSSPSMPTLQHSSPPPPDRPAFRVC